MTWMFLLIIPIAFLIYYLYRNDITKNEWFVYGIYENKWLWFHMLSTVIGVSILQKYIITNSTIVLIVLILAFGWELLEYVKNKFSKYSSFMHYFWDTVFDIVMAIAITIIMIQ